MALRSDIVRPDIVRRGAVYDFRRRLPTRTHQALERTHMIFSLRTTCPIAARRRAAPASRAFEGRFGNFCNQLGLTDPQIVFHRFRHTFVTALRNQGNVDAVKVCALVGHSHEAQVLHASYFQGYEPRVLADAVAKLEYGFEDELRKVFKRTRSIEDNGAPRPIKRRAKIP